MRGIVILFVACAAIFGVAMLVMAAREGGFEEAGRVVDQQVDRVGYEARQTVEEAGEAVERATDRAVGTN